MSPAIALTEEDFGCITQVVVVGGRGEDKGKAGRQAGTGSGLAATGTLPLPAAVSCQKAAPRPGCGGESGWARLLGQYRASLPPPPPSLGYSRESGWTGATSDARRAPHRAMLQIQLFDPNV